MRSLDLQPLSVQHHSLCSTNHSCLDKTSCATFAQLALCTSELIQNAKSAPIFATLNRSVWMKPSHPYVCPAVQSDDIDIWNLVLPEMPSTFCCCSCWCSSCLKLLFKVTIDMCHHPVPTLMWPQLPQEVVKTRPHAPLHSVFRNSCVARRSLWATPLSQTCLIVSQAAKPLFCLVFLLWRSSDC